MKTKATKALFLGALLLAGGRPALHAQTVSIPWWVVAAGGGASSNGQAVALTGTIGQYEAVQTLSATNISLMGGFWYNGPSQLTPCLSLECPSNLVVTTCGATSVPVNYPSAIATDLCCTNGVTVIYNPPSGSSFAPDTTNAVEVTAFDVCGHTNTCSFTVTVLQGTNCCNQTTTVGNSLAPPQNGNADDITPLVILGEYNPAGPQAGSLEQLPGGTIQDVKFYGSNYEFILYVLSYVGPGPHPNEREYQVVASQGFTNNSVQQVGTNVLSVTNMPVHCGDLIAWWGIGPWYPNQPSGDQPNLDATYQNPTGTVYQASPIMVSEFTVGTNGDLNATYDYIPNALNAYYNQGRYYAIAVDVLKCSQCSSNCLTLACPNNIITDTCSNSVAVDYEALANDICTTNYQIVYDPPPGTQFPLGISPVNVTAFDSLGNTNECSFTVTVLQGTNCCNQTTTVGNSLAPPQNGNADDITPLVILGEYNPAGPQASSLEQLPGGAIQNVKFYGSNYEFILYVLSYVGPGPHPNEREYQVVASQGFTNNSVQQVGTNVLSVTNMPVHCGDLIAWWGIGPWYPNQPSGDQPNLDATYQNPTGTVYQASPIMGSEFTVGTNGDLNATYDYIPNALNAYYNQGRYYAIAVDVLKCSQCSSNCLTLACPNNIITDTCSNSVAVDYEALANDICTTNYQIVYDPPPGTQFPLGISPVNVTAFDSLGNTNECSFTVTVLQDTNCCTNSFNLVNFGSNAINVNLQLNGNAAAAVIGVEATPVLRLTPAAYDQMGSAFVPVQLGANLSFSTEFAFQLSDGGGVINDGDEPNPEPYGADGIAFVLAPSSTALGVDGYGVGYLGIPNSVAIKFDTFRDYSGVSSAFSQIADPNGNFVAVYTDGSVSTLGYVPYSASNPTVEPQYYSPPTFMKNGDIWYAWIDYNGLTGELDVRLSDSSPTRPATPQLVQSISLDNLSYLGALPQLYAGFTAGTAAQYENNDILSWQFSSPCSNACISILCSNIMVTTCSNCALVPLTATINDLCCSNADWVFIYDSGYLQGGTNNPSFCFPVNTTNTVGIIAYDPCGNQVSNFFTVKVLPGTCQTNCITLVCPSNIVMVACSNGTTVNFPEPLANDTCCGNVAYSFNPPSGSFFYTGTFTPVQVTATDSCGNTASCSFGVAVVAAVDPVVSLNTNVVVASACSTGCGLVPYVGGELTVSGGNSVPMISQNPQYNTPICTNTTVTLKYSNTCGFITNFYVEVILDAVCSNAVSCLTWDCPPSLIVTNCGTNSVPVFFDSICASAPCCGNEVGFCYDPPSGTVFPLGTWPVQASVWDLCGDTNTCTIYVTVVQDSNLPVITVPTNIPICAGSVATGRLVVDGGSWDFSEFGFCSEDDGSTYATNLAAYLTRDGLTRGAKNILIYSADYLPLTSGGLGDELYQVLTNAGYNVFEDTGVRLVNGQPRQVGFEYPLKHYLENSNFDAVFLAGGELYTNGVDHDFCTDFLISGCGAYPNEAPQTGGIPALLNFITNGGGLFVALGEGNPCANGSDDAGYPQWSEILNPFGLAMSNPQTIDIANPTLCGVSGQIYCSTNIVGGGTNLFVTGGSLTVVPSPVMMGVTNLFYRGANEVSLTGSSPLARLVAFTGSHGLIGVSGALAPTNNGCGVMPNLAPMVQIEGGGPFTISQSIPPGTEICTSTTVMLTISNACGYATNIPVQVNLGPSCTNCLTLECPSNIVVTCQSNGAAVNYPQPTVTDSCCTNGYTISYNPPFGYLFPPSSTTPVEVTVADSCGHTNTCSFTVTVLPGPQVVYVGNSLEVTNGAPDYDSPLVILGEYSQAGPLPTSAKPLPPGTAQDVRFYGQIYNFTLYALSPVATGPYAHEQTFEVVASQSFSNSTVLFPTNQVLSLSNFCVQAGDLLAFAGIGPYYAQNPNDLLDTDATYEDSSSPDSYVATPPAGGFGPLITLGANPDPNANYEYINNGQFMNQGRTYGIGVDVVEDSACSVCSSCLTIDCQSNIVVTTCTNSALVCFNVTATDPCTTNYTVVSVPPSCSLFPLGKSVVQSTAFDALGSSATCSFTVTVLPCSPSSNCITLVCPSNIVATTCGNAARVYFSPYVNDRCTSDRTLISVPPSGSLFPLGTTTVYETAFDALGNSSSCSFTVTVNSCQSVETNACGENLSAELVGNSIFVTWDGVGVLQTTTNLLHPNWLNVPGNSLGFYATTASEPAQFFRVACPAVALSVGPAGVSLLNGTNLLSAFPILNEGTATATNLTLTGISLPGASLTAPLLATNLGTLASGDSFILNSDFVGSNFNPGQSYTVTLRGNYYFNNITDTFNINLTLTVPPAPGSNKVNSVTVPSSHVNGGGPSNQPPSFDVEINPPGPPVPTALFVAGAPTPLATGLNSMTNQDEPQDNTVEIVGNQSLGVTDAYTFAEPSGSATSGGVVFVTFNRSEAYSTNGGASFTELYAQNIFPGVDYGIDQVVQYVPNVDLFIWVLEGPGGYILAVSTPASLVASGGTDWTYWNLTAQLLGQPVGTGLDYPDVSVGNNYLYISWDAGDGCPMGCSYGRQVVRTLLSGLKTGGTITIDYTNPQDVGVAWGSHLTQNVQDEIFWAGHDDNSHLRVFSWADNSSYYYWTDIGISTWANNSLSSYTPDGNNWLAAGGHGGFPGNAVLGSTLLNNQLWFAWTAGTDNNFPQPHIEMVTLDLNNNFNVIQQVQIWNPNYAFGYPALATSCPGQVGIALEWGGGGNYYENFAVGFWGDYLVYNMTDSNVGTTNYGDYVTLRPAPVTSQNPGNLLSGFGYGVLNNGGVLTRDVHYVTFGRPASDCTGPGTGNGVYISRHQ